jgi:hypothetical protein
MGHQIHGRPESPLVHQSGGKQAAATAETERACSSCRPAASSIAEKRVAIRPTAKDRPLNRDRKDS